MKQRELAGLLDALATTHGVRAAALVESGSGLVWHASGAESFDATVWAAAIDQWRVHSRNRGHLEALGPMQAVVMYQASSTLALLPCGEDSGLIVACIAAPRTVNWADWQRRVRGLAQWMAARMEQLP